jgi:hypothetical protein
MKRKLAVAAVVVLGALAVYIGLNFSLGSAVRVAVNRLGPRLTKTKVELAGAYLSPLSGSGTLSGLYVGNPPGWSPGKAFYLGKIHIRVAPSSLFGDHIVVKEVLIERPDFVYETKVVSSNIGDLLKAIDQASGSGQAGAAATKGGKPLKFEVKRFRLEGGRVTLGVGSAAMVLPMPPIELDDLGTAQGGITSDQLALAVVRTMMNSVVGATTRAAGKIGSTMGAAAGNAVGKASESLKGLFGGQK